jgi:hypothetical protein
MENSTSSILSEELQQFILELMLKHMIQDLNHLLAVPNKSIGTEVAKQRIVLLSILSQSNQHLEMDHTKSKKVFFHFQKN